MLIPCLWSVAVRRGSPPRSTEPVGPVEQHHGLAAVAAMAAASCTCRGDRDLHLRWYSARLARCRPADRPGSGGRGRIASHRIASQEPATWRVAIPAPNAAQAATTICSSWQAARLPRWATRAPGTHSAGDRHRHQRSWPPRSPARPGRTPRTGGNDDGPTPAGLQCWRHLGGEGPATWRGQRPQGRPR
jgi:hypothetical protein